MKLHWKVWSKRRKPLRFLASPLAANEYSKDSRVMESNIFTFYVSFFQILMLFLKQQRIGILSLKGFPIKILDHAEVALMRVEPGHTPNNWIGRNSVWMSTELWRLYLQWKKFLKCIFGKLSIKYIYTPVSNFSNQNDYPSL